MLGACDEADDCDLMANVLEVASLKELSSEMSLSPNPFKEDVETFIQQVVPLEIMKNKQKE